MDMIRADKLSKAFGTTQAVKELSFDIPEGSLFGLMGPDGAGKSTTLRLLCGLLRPTSGKAEVAGLDTRHHFNEIKNLSRHMSQGFDLYTDLSIEENLRFFADMLGVSKNVQKSRMDQLLAFTHLAPFRKRLAANLSGGMKQKLALAVALIQTPRVLFLDEPTSGVDPVSRRDFWRALYHLQEQGVTLFVTTSYLDEAERCGQIGLLHEGRLLALGAPRELKQQFGREVLEIQCDQPRLAMQLLRQGLPRARVGLYGSRIHMTNAKPTSIQPDIRLILQGAGIILHEIQPIKPTLEDIFVSLIAPTNTAVAYGR